MRSAPSTPYLAWLGKYRKLKAKAKRQSKLPVPTDKSCPFSVGQIIFNKKRPTIRRMIIEEPKLVRKTLYSQSFLKWECIVLNLRKTANAGKKSKFYIDVTDVSDFEVFSDLEMSV